jgi:hypothetical protein
VNPTAIDILKHNRLASSEFGGGLANHLSMTIVALDRLGASEQVQAAFARGYRHRNELTPLRSLGDDAGPCRLGDRRQESCRVREMLQEMRVFGRDRTLRRHLPGLLRGIGASAFHAMIRTAYGVEAADDDEIAFGLAYWQSTWLDLGAPAGRRDRTSDVDGLIATFGAYVRHRGEGPAGGLIHFKLRQIAGEPYFASFADSAAIDADSLPKLATLARRIFATTLDFTALHLVTSAHALRVLSPWIEDRGWANAMFWRALLAADGGIQAPLIEEPLPIAAWGWDELATRAIATGDDHAVKLTYTARSEAAFYGCEAYRAAAAAYVAKFASYSAA